MRKATSILIEEDFNAFIEKKIADGRYETKGDVIEAALKLMRERDEDLEALRGALIEGEASGEPVDFDFDAFLSEKRAQRGKGA